MIYPRNNENNVFPFFKEIFNNIADCTVLDFGGNQGNLLHFANGEIKEKNYTCVDVAQDAIENGKEEFHNATWIHYDKFNYMYNHEGVQPGFPLVHKNQDLIFAYSVFTHTDLKELIYTLKWLTTFNFKKIAVSVLDINNEIILDYFYKKRIETYYESFDLRTLKDKGHNIAYFINNNEIIIDEETYRNKKLEYFVTFYDINHLQSVLKEHGLNTTITRPGRGIIPFLCIE